jgi:3-oxoacyl-[acyl-carrier protein] reductase
MRRQGKGRIINVTSVAARNGGGPGSAAYATAKGGVSTLTRAMAKELVADGVLVNGIAPGVIAIPLGREGAPEETVGAVLFLASSAADYLVGEIIGINGGLLMS